MQIDCASIILPITPPALFVAHIKIGLRFSCCAVILCSPPNNAFDAASNALFGGLQRITAQQLNLSPILMCATNSAGGVMGKMIDAQSICIATAATNQVGNEGSIFRFVFWHSVALAAIIGVIVMLYAYVFPQFIPHGLTFVH